MPAPLSTFRGLSLPPSRFTGGYFASQTTKARVYSDLLITMFTPIGGRAFNRSFGSGFPGLPFNQVTNSVVTLIVQGAAATWVPYIKIGSVQVGKVTNKQVPLKINYTVPNAV